MYQIINQEFHFSERYVAIFLNFVIEGKGGHVVYCFVVEVRSQIFLF